MAESLAGILFEGPAGSVLEATSRSSHVVGMVQGVTLPPMRLRRHQHNNPVGMAVRGGTLGLEETRLSFKPALQRPAHSRHAGNESRRPSRRASGQHRSRAERVPRAVRACGVRNSPRRSSRSRVLRYVGRHRKRTFDEDTEQISVPVMVDLDEYKEFSYIPASMKENTTQEALNKSCLMIGLDKDLMQCA